jgi:hypothetical protein
MRYVLGAAIEAGYSIASIASIVEVQPGTIQARAQKAGLLRADVAEWLTDRRPDELQQSSIRIVRGPDQPLADFYPAIDVMLHLAGIDPTDNTQSDLESAGGL